HADLLHLHSFPTRRSSDLPPVRAVVMKSAEGRRPSALNRRTLLFRKLYVSLTFSATLRRRVLSWYRRSGRDLPWRHTRDPYRVLDRKSTRLNSSHVSISYA